MPVRQFQAKMSFTSPFMDRRFVQGQRYDLDDDAVDAMSDAITKGRLVEVEEPPVGRTTRPAAPADAGTSADAQTSAETGQQTDEKPEPPAAQTPGQ